MDCPLRTQHAISESVVSRVRFHILQIARAEFVSAAEASEYTRPLDWYSMQQSGRQTTVRRKYVEK